jgi:threonine/homoserine/homoserine lactone efflux protein
MSLPFLLTSLVNVASPGTGALYTIAAGMRSHVISRPRVLVWMRGTFASVFVALGAKLAFTTR